MFFGWLRGIIGSLFFWLGWVFLMCYVVGSQDLELNSVILTPIVNSHWFLFKIRI